MARRWSRDKIAVMDGLADEILHSHGMGRTLVAVDGIDGAGQGRFADELAVSLGRGGHAVFRASVDAFHRPRAQRYARGDDSAEGYYLDAFDYEAFRRVLVDPFRMGGSAAFVTSFFDAARDVQVEPVWQTGPQDAALVIDGVFLGRPELRGLWHWSAWLEVDPVQALERMAARGGAGGPSSRYQGGQALYLADANPRAHATVIIDNTDPADPRREGARREPNDLR
jgi:uridine kinase